MWSQYSDSQINIAQAVLMFSTVSWVAGHRVSGVVCFGPQRTWWRGVFENWVHYATVCVCECLSMCACLSLRVHEFVLCRVELEPSPTPVCFTCISMKRERWFTLLLQSASLSQPVKQTLISLPGKVTHSVVQLFQSLSSPFHLYLGKALTPHTAAM